MIGGILLMCKETQLSSKTKLKAGPKMVIRMYDLQTVMKRSMYLNKDYSDNNSVTYE